MRISRLARQFATIFRREAHRTQMATAAAIGRVTSGDTVTLDDAAQSDMDGYDGWAALAIDRYFRFRTPSRLELISIASAMCRSPMCEVAWIEYCLSEFGSIDTNRYNIMRKKYSHVRSFPTTIGISDVSLVQMMRHSNARSELGVMLHDTPWITPYEILYDKKYMGTIPEADLSTFEGQWDADGLLKRVDHEMLVIQAAFDDSAKRRLLE